MRIGQDVSIENVDDIKEWRVKMVKEGNYEIGGHCDDECDVRAEIG